MWYNENFPTTLFSYSPSPSYPLPFSCIKNKFYANYTSTKFLFFGWITAPENKEIFSIFFVVKLGKYREGREDRKYTPLKQYLSWKSVVCLFTYDSITNIVWYRILFSLLIIIYLCNFYYNLFRHNYSNEKSWGVIIVELS